MKKTLYTLLATSILMSTSFAAALEPTSDSNNTPTAEVAVISADTTAHSASQDKCSAYSILPTRIITSIREGFYKGSDALTFLTKEAEAREKYESKTVESALFKSSDAGKNWITAALTSIKADSHVKDALNLVTTARTDCISFFNEHLDLLTDDEKGAANELDGLLLTAYTQLNNAREHAEEEFKRNNPYPQN